MGLQHYITSAFPDGLPYNEAAQLCLRLYCTVDRIPSDLHAQCTKGNLSTVFARLAEVGFVTGGAEFAVLYGANFHTIHEKGHWVEVIASIFKKENIVESLVRESLDKRLTIASTTIGSSAPSHKDEE